MTLCLFAGPVVMVMDLIDEFISRSCPFVAAGVVIGSVYWTAVTFGAVTVMQVGLLLPYCNRCDAMV